MLAGHTFAGRLEHYKLLNRVARLQVTLYGSLAFTGRGHGTDKAVMLGLSGELPDKVDPDAIDGIVQDILERGCIQLAGRKEVAFAEKTDLLFNKRTSLPHHTNGMRFVAFDERSEVLIQRDYYSVGGGFVVNHDEAAADRIVKDATPVPFPFSNCTELLSLCADNKLSIAGVMMANERAWRSKKEIRGGLLNIWAAMHNCIKRGYKNSGVLPGGLKVHRRAPDLYRELSQLNEKAYRDPLKIIDWVNLYALAVNEENAAGGRVVTAPTNGAAGIIPAVLNYYCNFIPNSNEDGIIDFLLTAGAIGILYVLNASISGAEVGCQGEVGVACSMAAGGLTAALGGTMSQVENAAEIGMEHNLGLTCDPVGGLVQIPCIERNAMGSIKAINAQRLAMQAEGKHKVSLDKVIKTMRDTGADMKNRYKETSRGGLAVNVIEC
jgi:L-serine dehydratase